MRTKEVEPYTTTTAAITSLLSWRLLRFPWVWMLMNNHLCHHCWHYILNLNLKFIFFYLFFFIFMLFYYILLLLLVVLFLLLLLLLLLLNINNIKKISNLNFKFSNKNLSKYWHSCQKLSRQNMLKVILLCWIQTYTTHICIYTTIHTHRHTKIQSDICLSSYQTLAIHRLYGPQYVFLYMVAGIYTWVHKHTIAYIELPLYGFNIQQ